MRDSLLVDPSLLPGEGKLFSGEISPGMFDLPAGDARPAGPLAYRLRARLLGTGLFLTGELESPFEFTCVRDLRTFVKTIRLPDAAISVETDGSETDVTPALREEILLQFPAYPCCADADEPRECEIDARYFTVDKREEDDVEPLPGSAGDSRWEALDKLSGLSGEEDP